MARIKRLAGTLVIVLPMVVMFGAGWLVAKLRVGSTVDRASLSELERRFSDQMHGSALVGRFTIAGREDRPAIVERYDISSVEKVGGDHWRFNARIRYGSVDTTLPVVVTMLWAADTPMIDGHLPLPEVLRGRGLAAAMAGGLP